MAVDQINERTSRKVLVEFFDAEGEPVTPSSATYRIDDRASGEAMLADTAIGSLATSVTLTVTPSQNRILYEANSRELRVLTVEFVYGSGLRGTAEYTWQVKNLFGVSDTAPEDPIDLPDPILLGGGMAAFLTTPTSANLRAALTDETGAGSAVFADAPDLTGIVTNEDPGFYAFRSKVTASGDAMEGKYTFYVKGTGGIYSHSELVISGNAQDDSVAHGPGAIAIMPPTLDPFMVGVTSDIIGPALQIRNYAVVNAAARMADFLDHAGGYVLSILDSGALSWGPPLTGTFAIQDVTLGRNPTTGALALVSGVTAQKLEIYGTSSVANANYVRGEFYADTVSVNIAATSAGTGAANLSVNLIPKGTGSVAVYGSAGCLAAITCEVPNSTPGVVLRNRDASGYLTLDMYGGSSINSGNRFYIGQYNAGNAFIVNLGAHDLGLWTNGAERMAILSNGLVSFGGGNTSSYPALKRSTTVLQSRLADDSGYCYLQGILVTHSNATTGLSAGVLSATTNASIQIVDAAGQVYRVPCII